MDDYLAKMEDLYIKLCCAGKDLGEDTMETRADDALTMNLIREKLLHEVSKQNQNSTGGSALKAAGCKSIVCHLCKQLEHKQREANSRKNRKTRGTTTKFQFTKDLVQQGVLTVIRHSDRHLDIYPQGFTLVICWVCMTKYLACENLWVA